MEIFEKNPHLQECWETSDGKKFYNPNTAALHAKTLPKDKRAVDHLKRPASVDKKKPINSNVEVKTLAKMNRAELDAEAKKLGFDSTGIGSKKEVIDAIEKLKSEGSEGKQSGEGSEGSVEGDKGSETENNK